MISAWLLSVVRCPVCVTNRPMLSVGLLVRNGESLICADCGAHYPVHAHYLDLRPPRPMAGKETVYIDPAADLDDLVIRRPVLSAGVRLRVLRRMLRMRPTDAALDIGCGNGKFALWNRPSVRQMVGLDPAARFAPAACGAVDLVQGDARALPFAPGIFDAAYSIDVFEHLDLAGVRSHLRETRRVLSGDGGYFCFSNTRERSWLNRLIDPGRRAAEVLHRVGVVDRTRDHLRKGDHVKAVETTDRLSDEFTRAGLHIARLWFLNPLFATYIETLGVAIAERAMMRRQSPGTDRGHSDGTQIPRISVRDTAGSRPLVRFALDAATALLMADVAFFRGVRTGPFFLLARPVPDR